MKNTNQNCSYCLASLKLSTRELIVTHPCRLKSKSISGRLWTSKTEDIELLLVDEMGSYNLSMF